jgi:hypothetical protein
LTGAVTWCAVLASCAWFLVLCIGLGTTLAYSVKDNRWTDLKQATKAAEGLVFDRRHKVFITASWGNEPEALRYKGNGE